MGGMRPTGHLQVKGPPGRRRWHALWRDAEGRHQRVLGPAHVKPGPRSTPRGAVAWRVADGRKPGPEWLTPREARERLAVILEDAPRVARPRGPAAVTFGDACLEWLRYVEHDRLRASSTLRDYRNSVRRYLLPGLGADTPVASITTEDVDDFRERMLGEGRLSRRSIQKILVLLHGILKRAKRKKWIKTNPAEDAERVTVQRSGDFSVLAPEEVESLARAAACEQDAAIFVVAAFTGLRLGEIRGLRWADVDFGKSTIHVRRNIPQHGVERVPKSGKVRSVPLADRAAEVLDGLSRRGDWTSDADFVFVHALGGPVDAGRLRIRFHAAREHAGLKYLRFHDLRHTFGTLAVRVFPLTDVKAYMGHADVQTTMLYVHHVPQHDAADKLSAALRAETTPAVLTAAADRP
jgi:integrase